MANPIGPTTVLIVEDERPVREALLDIFSLTGHRVFATGDGLAAFHMIQAERPDIVVLDLMLPSLTGQGLLRKLRDDPATRDLPVIVLTGFPERLTDEDRRLASAVYTKPFEVDTVLDDVARLTRPP